MSTTPHSRVTASKPNNAKFVKYLPHETAASAADAKYLAQDVAEANRYVYRAKATLVGHAGVSVGNQIYLDNLAHGMSGYWTVLSVTHLFGSGNAQYQMDVVLGADVLGDVNPNAAAAADTRDFDAEFSGKSLNPTNNILTDYSLDVTAGVPEPSGTSVQTSKNTPLSYSPPAQTTYTPDLYQYDVPDISSIRRTITWRAE